MTAEYNWLIFVPSIIAVEKRQASRYCMGKQNWEVQMKFSPLAVVLIASLIAAPLFAQSEDQEVREGGRGRAPRGRRGPPPEAVEACDGKASGDACSFTGRRGENLEGVCGIGRGGGTQLACRPNNNQEGEMERRPRPRDERGEE